MGWGARQGSPAWKMGLALALAGWAAGAAASEPGAPPAAAASADQAPRLEVSASELPRVDGSETSFAAPRIDFTLLPARRSAVGLALGLGAPTPPSPLPVAAYAPATPPAVDVGLHWRHTLDSSQRIDVTAWRRMASPQPDAHTLIQMRQPTYGARVEFNLSGARKGLVADKGFLGFQMESGARLSLRRKNGVSMIYYRNKF